MAGRQATYAEIEATSVPPAMASGMILLGAIFMVLGGFFQALAGFAAVIENDFIVVGEDYAYEIDITVWGIVHMVLGGLLIAAGLALISGATWARIVAVVVVGLAAIQNFLSIPYQPLWSIVLLTIDGLILWAVVAHGGKLRTDEGLPSIVPDR